MPHAPLTKLRAFQFVVILGLVNLFADTTYEGASSINGPFLRLLGASATAVGIIAGVAEFFGYSLRFLSGFLADKTGKYWLITFIGYSINLLAVPALALVGNWPTAAFFIIAERVGRAIRKPTVEAMLSYTAGDLGKGQVYALNTALDQIGATIGPLLMALVLFLKGSYTTGYALLLIPAVLALLILAVARHVFPTPSSFETIPLAKIKGFGLSYWLYMAGGACVAAGLVSFELISYHFSNGKVVPAHWIPLLFAFAMATDALASLFFGRLFDRVGLPSVIAAFFLSSFFAPFVFLGGASLAFVGMFLWGIGFGAQDTLLKALIAGILPKGKRNLAFGLFYVGYGSGWLIGSTITGLLYAQSLFLLVAFSVALQLLSLPLFILARKQEKKQENL